MASVDDVVAALHDTVVAINGLQGLISDSLALVGLTTLRPKVLGQSAPGAGTLTDLYTVASGQAAFGSSIVACNTNAGAALFRVSIAVAGAADALSQYIYYDWSIPGNDTFIATIGMRMAATDVVRVRSDIGGVSFTLFGATAVLVP